MARAASPAKGAKAPPKPSKAPPPQRVAVAGVRPALFKLLARAEDSFFVYRSSRKLGTARIEENGAWTARIEDGDHHFEATAESGSALLELVGAWMLTHEARAEASLPVEDTNPDLRVKGRKGPEERLSIEFAKRAQASRIASLDATLSELGRQIKRTGGKRA